MTTTDKKLKSCQNGDASHCHSCDEKDFNTTRELVSIGVALILFIIGVVFYQPLHDTPFSTGEYAVLITAYLLSGWQVLWTALRNLTHGKVFDENFLMALATASAIAIHQLPEAVAVMLFYRTGEFLQELSVNRSRRSIKALLDTRPNYASIITDNGLKKVSPQEVEIGEHIIVKTGERIPLDGIVLEGQSLVDTSALTGESVPRRASKGSDVLAGTISKTGSLTIKVTKKFADSSISQVLNLVENSAARKAPTEKFITKFTRYYTPTVVIGALFVAIIPPLFLTGAAFSEWIYRALVLLVISCPCALVISVPLGYFGGIGGASRRGILIKGAAFLDALTEIKTAVFDKTGTLTRGVFKVKEIIPRNGYSTEDLLRLSAIAESHSNHPIAQSILQAYGERPDSTSVKDHFEFPGMGVTAKINGRSLVVGGDRLLHRQGISHDEVAYSAGGTVVHIAIDDRYAGYIVISDEVKSDAAETIRSLKKLGIKQTVMLTGDTQEAAEAISKEVGVDRFLANLLPEDKVKALEDLKAGSTKKEKIAFVGDGINDAPVVALADVGIAMGGLGSDAAIEISDVVIMTDAPSKLPEAIKVARKTRAIIWQNITLAFVIKGVFISLGIAGIATIWGAVFADVGVALLAVLNSTRAMR